MTRREAVATLTVTPLAVAALARGTTLDSHEDDAELTTMPDPATADVLMLHSSRSGQTQRITRFLAERARKAGHSVAVEELAAFAARPRGPLPPVVLIAASIQFGRHHDSVIDFVRARRRDLESVRSGFLSVSLSAAQPAKASDAEGYLRTFLQETGWAPAEAMCVAGALRYRHYGFIRRMMMKKIASEGGLPTDTTRDHEFTDWRAVGCFADGLLAAAVR